MATNNPVSVPAINYEETKAKYEELVNANTELMNRHPLSTNQKIEDKIRQIQNMEATELDLAVLNHSSKTKLYRKRENKLLEVLSVDDSFSVVLDTHISLGHTSAAITYKELVSKLSIPTFAVSWVVLACNVCEHNRKNKTPRPVSSVAQKAVAKPVVEPTPTESQPIITMVQKPLTVLPKPEPTPSKSQPVIPMVQEPLTVLPKPKSQVQQARVPSLIQLSNSILPQQRTVFTPQRPYKNWRLSIIKRSLPQSQNTRNCYLLILRHIPSDFLILRAVYETLVELSLELLKIFTEFGYPSKLYVSKTLEFYVRVIQLVVAMNPVEPFEVQLADTKFFDDDETQVITEIHKWMDLMKDVYWDQCLPMVQYRMNTKEVTFVRMDTKEKCIGIPFEMFFNFKVSTEIKWLNPKTNELACDFDPKIVDENEEVP
ncbi:hypothetical protein B5X24_HaOG204047 [Helicoverpa armigera]|uniref:Uncharacterized protein n=1 Tax=Helicoverpa armigera TaxID=29058 RepID=A0A2W1BTA6_HELAM|nr:hypothetical protein B5X24_HaOG204047 [Helicoverpa armigera]